MEFPEIIKRINEKVKYRDDYLTTMQYERAEYRNSKRIAQNKFLNINRHFVGNKKYSFHYGGSNEFQFNVGVESNNTLRFGLAFSLETSKSINDPIGARTPEIKRFNKLFSENPELFDELDMFIYNKKEQKLYEGNVREIKDSEIAVGNFIFFGGLTTEKYMNLNEDDLDVIIDRLAAMFPIYTYVQHGFKKDIRICRVTFNQNNWVAPSGREGKSRNKNTQEGQHGFGYEEWLLNLGYEIDGYHYGFLEPISKYSSAYQNRIFDIYLYTIRQDPSQRFWVGKISNCTVIDEIEAKTVLKHYEDQGWKEIMIHDLKRVQLDPKNLKSNWNASLFNVKFRTSDLDLLDELLEVSKDDKAISTGRYQLSQFKGLPDSSKEDSTFDIDDLKSREGLLNKAIGKRSSSIYTINYLHNEISLALEDYLRKNGHLVEFEKSTGFGTSIDMMSEKSGLKTIYEIKTAHTAKACIRQAFGQLMEYAYFPDRVVAERLVVVGIQQPKLKDEKYIKHLRSVSNLDIRYWHFDNAKSVLIKEIK
jgi:hypothetical protein